MKAAGTIAIATGSLLGAFFAGDALFHQNGHSAAWAYLHRFPISFHADSLSAFFLIVIFSVSLLAAIYSFHYLGKPEKSLRGAVHYLFFSLLVLSMALVVVTIPIFFPLVMKLGFDPIWFGVIIVLVAEMGVITPPVGVNVFVIKGIAPEIPLHVIFRGIFPFLGGLVVLTILLMFFPQIATYLPSLISY